MTPPYAPTITALEAVPAREQAGPLHAVLERALDTGDLHALADAQPVDRRDRFLCLLSVYDLHTAPIDELGDRVRLQGAPEVAALKARLEQPWLDELEAAWADAGALAEADDVDRVVKAMRAVAARDRLPAAYRWLAKEASWDELVQFLAVEGGPDGGFDDLVAVCQLGLSGSAKLELGKNYWDEMGQGDADGVHTLLHQRMAAAIDMPHVPRAQLPVEALERAALGGLMATIALAAARDGRRARPARAAGRPALPAGAAGVRPAGGAAGRVPVLRRARRGRPGARQGLDGQGGRADRRRAPRLGPADRQGRLVALDGQPAVLRGGS